MARQQRPGDSRGSIPHARAIALLLLLVAPLNRPARAGAPASALAILHVTVIDGTSEAPAHDQTGVAEGGRIVALGASAEVRAPPGATLVDASGKWLIPGLWDMHTHLQGDYPGAARDRYFPLACALYLANG